MRALASMLRTRDIKLAKHTENGDCHCTLSSLCGSHRTPPPRQNFSCLRNFSFAKHALSRTLTLTLSLTLHPQTREDNGICFCIWENPKEIANNSAAPGSPGKTGLVIPGGPGKPDKTGRVPGCTAEGRTRYRAWDLQGRPDKAGSRWQTAELGAGSGRACQD